MKKIYMITFLSLAMSVAMAQSDDSHKEFQVTPSISTLSFPHPLDGAVELVFGQTVGLKYSQSFKPHGNLQGSEAELDNRSIALRSYFDQGPWFLGVAYGHHEIDIKRNETINGFNTNIYANVKSDYITPMTGWKWISENGFTLGVEIGWIFAINPSTRVTSDQDANPLVIANSEYQSNRKDAEDQANKYVRDGVPDIGLLELGWTF